MKRVSVKDYLSSVGINKIKTKNIKEYLYSISSEHQLIDSILYNVEYFRLYRLRQNCDNFYKFKNTDLSICKAVTSFYYYEHLSKVCRNLSTYKKHLKGEVLEIGCDIGITSCFLALLRPDLHFTCIDRCENAINIANSIKNELKLQNITFKAIDLEDLVHYVKSGNGPKFDSIISSNVLKENTNEVDFDPYGFLEHEADSISPIFYQYIEYLDQITEKSAIIITIEAFKVPSYPFAWVKAMNRYKFLISPTYTKRYRCKILDDEKDFCTFIFNKEKSAKDDIIYLLYKETFMDELEKDSGVYSGDTAAIILSNYGRDLILGFDIYDTNKEKAARLLITATEIPDEVLFLYCHISEDNDWIYDLRWQNTGFLYPVIEHVKKEVLEYIDFGYIVVDLMDSL